jgi:hypothetical protein
MCTFNLSISMVTDDGLIRLYTSEYDSRDSREAETEGGGDNAKCHKLDTS